jgi:hypothetical protein
VAQYVYQISRKSASSGIYFYDRKILYLKYDFRCKGNRLEDTKWMLNNRGPVELPARFCLILVPYLVPTHIGFEMLIAVTMKMRSSVPGCDRRFGGTYCVRLQSEKYANKSLNLLFACILHLRSWRWSQYVPPNCQRTYTRLHGVKFQNIVLFFFLQNFRARRNIAFKFSR